MPVSLIVCIVDGRKLFNDGRRGHYKIYRKVFEDAGISIDRWHRHRQEMAEEGMSGVDYDDPLRESSHFRPSILKMPFLKKLTKGTTGAEEALKPTAPGRPAPPPQTYPVKDLFNMNKNLERENNPQ